ncbi:MAG: preprotein translocase subunit YajC [Chloroflexi bacterium]|nr:preprotein translocase subunit YajC [Chloroflexota bacterium]
MEVVLALTVVVFAFYFILLRPVIAQQRRQRRDIAGLAEGDEVLTTGGFYARVREIRTQDDGPMLILLEAAPGVVLRATPHAIEKVSERAAEAAARASEAAETRSLGGAE